jgi:sugar phosphate permease
VICALFGLATGFWTFFLLRILLGVAEGPAFPALNRGVANWLPIQQRARALALGLSAVPFASVIGAPLISHLILTIGWRYMFIILGVIGFIWALVWYKFFNDQPQHSPYVLTSELDKITAEKKYPATRPKTPWKKLLLNPALLTNHYAFFSFGYLLFFSITWLPAYFEQTYDLKLKAIAFFLIAPWLLGTILILMGGLLSDWLFKKTGKIRIARSHLIWICQLISALCFIPVIVFHSLSISLIFISLAIGIGLMPNAAFYALNIDLVPDHAATSLGITDCAFAIAGILAPLSTGLLTHFTNNYTAAISLLIAFTYSSALGIILFQHPDKKRKDL